MWSAIQSVLKQIDDFVWGVPLMVLILSGGLLLTVRLGLLQVRKLGLALKWMVQNEEEGEGEISSFAALCTALSATIGTGNIVGVATAVCAGGPGALFWMIVAAFLGMATKYSEGLLAVKYRIVDESGHSLGGPFYYIEKGMGKNWKWLAKIFAFFGACVGLFGIGTFSQVNGISSAVVGFFDPDKSFAVTIPGLGTYSWVVVSASVVLTFCVAAVIIGGVKRIASVSQVVVPFMAIIYFIFALALVLFNIKEVPQAIVTIVKSAFNPKAVTGGVVGSMLVAMQNGVARGIFSNEAGLGSSPIVVAAAKTNSCVRQGLLSMTSVFFTTLIICTMTGIVVISSGLLDTTALDGSLLSNAAYNQGLPGNIGMYIVSIGLVFFSFTTIIGWCYYGERCLSYLVKSVHCSKIFKIVYILCIAVAPYLTLETVWILADITNALMAFPNLIALLALSPVVIAETKKFFDEEKKMKRIKK